MQGVQVGKLRSHMMYGAARTCPMFQKLKIFIRLRNWIFPTISVNKYMTVISKCIYHGWWAGEPWGSSGCEKHRKLALNSWGAYQRNDFSEPRFLHLPSYCNVLNSLIWDIWFSLINNYLLRFQPPGLCCKNSCVSRLFLYLFQVVPQSYLRANKTRLTSSVLSAK